MDKIQKIAQKILSQKESEISDLLKRKVKLENKQRKEKPLIMSVDWDSIPEINKNKKVKDLSLEDLFTIINKGIK